MRDWVRNLLSPSVRERVAGSPSSPNGASSFHLWWDVPYGDRLKSATVTLEISRRPDLDRLVFFAMQVAFIKPGGGGAHLGLQHNSRYPARSAVNWGGYDPHGGLLEGSESPLPSAPDDVNTRNYQWSDGVAYTLVIDRGDQRDDGWYRWRGSITDGGSGETTHVRDLYSPGAYLRAPVVWVESFAPCDAPRCEVRWSDASVVTEADVTLPINAMRVDYQPHAAGGCTNTNTILDGHSFVQRTGQLRTTKPGTTLAIS
ncbi:MAG: hypothetical protein M3132_05360 [Actinomycetia bacterium]|nr:hypothetical protein [Actinomycetes bacterium]